MLRRLFGHSFDLVQAATRWSMSLDGVTTAATANRTVEHQQLVGAARFLKPSNNGPLKTHRPARHLTVCEVRELAPDNTRRDNFKPALVATQLACGNRSLVTMGANVGVQQDLAVLSEHCLTMGT